jgi:hypothetical protein
MQYAPFILPIHTQKKTKKRRKRAFHSVAERQKRHNATYRLYLYTVAERKSFGQMIKKRATSSRALEKKEKREFTSLRVHRARSDAMFGIIVRP